MQHIGESRPILLLLFFSGYCRWLQKDVRIGGVDKPDVAIFGTAIARLGRDNQSERQQHGRKSAMTYWPFSCRGYARNYDFFA